MLQIKSYAVGEKSMSILSIVVPVYNEEASLEEFHRRLTLVLVTVDCAAEILYVNDGSSDSSAEILRQLHVKDPRVSCINLTRNFGKELAVTAGLDYSSGCAVVVIDADLQDPPELIPQFLDRWRQGFDVVYGQRTERRGESILKRVTARYFYRVMKRISDVQLPEDTGDFRLLSRRAVLALASLRERHRFMKGLFTWIGYPSTAVLYQRDARYAGASKWNYLQLINLAVEGITSFTTAPLRMASYLGIVTAVGALTYGSWVIYKTIKYGDPVAGYPSLMVVILFLGGVQLITLGVFGEYLGRIFNESKNRPLYLVESTLGRPAEQGRPLSQVD